MKKSFILMAILLSILSLVNGQGDNQKVVYVEDILSDVLSMSETDTFNLEKCVIKSRIKRVGHEEPSFMGLDSTYITSQFGEILKWDDNRLLLIKPFINLKNVLFDGITSENDYNKIRFSSGLKIEIYPQRAGYKKVKSYYGGLSLNNVKSPFIKATFWYMGFSCIISNSDIDNFDLLVGRCELSDCMFWQSNFGKLKINFFESTGQQYFSLRGCQINETNSSGNTATNHYEYEDGFYLNKKFEHNYNSIIVDNAYLTSIHDCKFSTSTSDKLILGIESEKTEIIDNYFNTEVLLTGTDTEKDFKFINNQLKRRISLSGVILPERLTSISIPWNQFSGNKLFSVFRLDGLYTEEGIDADFGKLYYADSLESFGQELAFDDLMTQYQIFYEIYKAHGNLESTNACYVELKDLYTQKYYYQYTESGSLRYWFRWKLNQLLKFYTEHGTDPARSLVISCYILLIFGLFYLIFPSEWDVKSKRQIFDRIKTIGDSLNKKKAKTIFEILYYSFVAILNAITLSLNSFVTLGFGTIPTKGIARYVVILQGFIGWFLLSIFTVALINQVLG